MLLQWLTNKVKGISCRQQQTVSNRASVSSPLWVSPLVVGDLPLSASSSRWQEPLLRTAAMMLHWSSATTGIPSVFSLDAQMLGQSSAETSALACSRSVRLPQPCATLSLNLLVPACLGSARPPSLSSCCVCVCLSARLSVCLFLSGCVLVLCLCACPCVLFLVFVLGSLLLLRDAPLQDLGRINCSCVCLDGAICCYTYLFFCFLRTSL